MGKSLKDVGRKVEKKREHLRDMPFETTPAQRLMRQEMEAGLHKSSAALAAVNPPSHDLDASIVSGGAPSKLGDVLAAEVGPYTGDGSPETTQLAYDIINKHGDGLKLGLREWQIIQNMVEAGIVAGRG